MEREKRPSIINNKTREIYMKDYIEMIKDKDELSTTRRFLILMFPIFFIPMVIVWIFDLMFNRD